jgi:hypothetical protein
VEAPYPLPHGAEIPGKHPPPPALAASSARGIELPAAPWLRLAPKDPPSRGRARGQDKARSSLPKLADGNRRIITTGPGQPNARAQPKKQTMYGTSPILLAHAGGALQSSPPAWPPPSPNPKGQAVLTATVRDSSPQRSKQRGRRSGRHHRRSHRRYTICSIHPPSRSLLCRFWWCFSFRWAD